MLRAAVLGYDLRPAGPALAAHVRAAGVPARLDRLATSYDTTIAPRAFVPAHARAHDWQVAIEDGLFPEGGFHAVFDLFRSDRDALSLLADPAPPGLRLYRYGAIWDTDDFEDGAEPFGGRLRAMVGDEPAAPTLDFAILGHDLLDRDEVSVLHLYHDDVLEGRTPTPETYPEVARAAGLEPGFALVQIEVARHPYWFPEG